MHYDKLKMRYKDEYMKLILDKYKKVKEKIELPEINQIKKQVSSELNQIIDHGIGLTLLNEEEVIGFIGGYQVDELFGSDKGIYVPLSGHGIKDEKLYPKLYEKISDIWVSEGYTSHSITMFTLDENIIEWFWLGFGLDALIQLGKLVRLNHISLI
jgi:hypothetical protein